MKWKKSLGLSLMLIACIGLACSVNAMPPMGLIKVSALSIIRKIKSGGTKDALHRAFLGSLDKRAEILLGADVWRDNGWKGYVTYASPAGGLYIVFLRKTAGKRHQTRPESNPEALPAGGVAPVVVLVVAAAPSQSEAAATETAEGKFPSST